MVPSLRTDFAEVHSLSGFRRNNPNGCENKQAESVHGPRPFGPRSVRPHVKPARPADLPKQLPPPRRKAVNWENGCAYPQEGTMLQRALEAPLLEVHVSSCSP